MAISRKIYVRISSLGSDPLADSCCSLLSVAVTDLDARVSALEAEITTVLPAVTALAAQAAASATTASAAATSAATASADAIAAAASAEGQAARFLLPAASDPTTRDNGDPLQDGDLYLNTAENEVRIYNGGAWTNPAAPQGALLFQDEGVDLGTAGTVTTVNFTGAGVTASRVGNVVTVNVAGGGGGGGITWESPKLVTVGTGGDYADINAAMADISANFAGVVLYVQMLDDLTSVSPTVVSFPSYVYAEVDLNGNEVGAGILSIAGGKDFAGVSGTGTLNSNGMTLQNLTDPFVGTPAVFTIMANATFRDCVLNALNTVDGGAGGQLLFQNVTSFDNVFTEQALVAISGSHRWGNVFANYALDVGNAIVANGGSVIDVGSFNNTGTTVTNVYAPANGIIFGGAAISGYTNYSADPNPEFGVVYGQSAWANATLVNDWAALGAPWATPGYRKVTVDVSLRGAAGGGTAATLFTLPTGHRPPYDMSFSVPVHDNTDAPDYGHLIVRATGVVELEHPGSLSNHKVWLDGVKFSVN